MTNWADVVFPLGILTLGAIVVSVVVWQTATILRARSARALRTEYRELAQRAVAAQEQTTAELATLRARVDALDEILRQVD